MYSDDQQSEHFLLGPRLSTDYSDNIRFRGESRRKYHRHVWVLQVVFFVISLSVLVSGLSFHNSKQQCECKDHMPMWSPALEAVHGTGHYHRFDGSFETPNMYKGKPSPSIDAAWDDITYATGGVMSVSADTIHAVNASEEFSVKLSEDIGGGYMASVEVLHQLHCLNMLRQASYNDYYNDTAHMADPWKDSPQVLRYHLDHCIDNLRQKLMCNADAGILSYVWVKDHPKPFPDFSVQHKCRDFRALKQWVVDRQVYTTESHPIERMPGFQELQSPP